MSFQASGDAPQRTGGEGRPAEPGPGPGTRADAATPNGPGTPAGAVPPDGATTATDPGTTPGAGTPAGAGTPVGAHSTAESAVGTQPAHAGKIPRTRTALAYNTLIAGAIVLILLLVFILENTQSVKITYFGVGFHMPLGVALLLAAIGGALLVGIVGTARIVQLRRRVRRQR